MGTVPSKDIPNKHRETLLVPASRDLRRREASFSVLSVVVAPLRSGGSSR